jgi:hypothetical protein
MRRAELRALDHQAVGLEIGHEARDGRAAQSRAASYLGT